MIIKEIHISLRIVAHFAKFCAWLCHFHIKQLNFSRLEGHTDTDRLTTEKIASHGRIGIDFIAIPRAEAEVAELLGVRQTLHDRVHETLRRKIKVLVRVVMLQR